MVFLSRFTLTVCLLSLMLLPRPLPSGQNEADPEQVYQERNEKGREVVYHLTRTGDSLRLKALLPDGGVEEQTFIQGTNGETTAWRYRDSSRDSALEAVLSGDRTVRLTGRHRGRPVDKTFKLNAQPWNQPFQQGLAPFLSSRETKTVFWAIGTRGKGELKITRFTVRREKASPAPSLLQQSGFSGPFHRIKISLHGLLSMFWSGHYWYDAADGSFLLYQGASSYLDGDVTLIRKK